MFVFCPGLMDRFAFAVVYSCLFLFFSLSFVRFIGRYATYTGPGFQEGVSLTCVDEVIRLRKYAYGACEMLLNKFKVGGDRTVGVRPPLRRWRARAI